MARKQKGLTNPYNKNFAKMDVSELKKIYETAVKRVNQALAEKRKQGQTQDPIYRAIESKGYRTKSTKKYPQGQVGFTRMKLKNASKSDIIKEYKKIYNAYTSESISSSKERFEGRMREQLAHIGVDYDEMMEHPDDYKTELNDFWDLYNEAEKAGLFEEFNLSSYEGQEVIKEYMQENRLPRGERGAKQVITRAKRRLQKINADASQDPMTIKDVYMRKELVDDYNRKKMKGMSDALLNKLAIKTWGTAPVEESFGEEEKRRYLL